MRQAVHILMEGVPPHLDIREIEAAMTTVDNVRAVHDLHVWTLTSGKEAISAHVLVDDLADGQHVLGDLQQLLRERFGIEHATIQLESDRSPLVQIRRTPESATERPARSGGDQAARAPHPEPAATERDGGTRP